MNFFRIKTSWSNAEFIVLKLCIASAYVLIGAYFSDFLLGFVVKPLNAHPVAPGFCIALCSQLSGREVLPG